MISSSLISLSICKGYRGFKLRGIALGVALVLAVALPASAHSRAGGNGSQAAAVANKAVSAASEPAATDKLRFDAASVRPSNRQSISLGAGNFLDPQSQAVPPKGGLFSWNVRLINLIVFGYDLRDSQMAQSVWEKLPNWAQNNRYAIETRAEGNPTRAEVREMVRSLLEERFQFAGHEEKRDGQVYALVVAKSGLRLKPHPEDAPCTLPLPKGYENQYPHIYPSYKDRPAHCGFFDRELGAAWERRYEMLDMTMQQIADSLETGSNSTAVDRTGLVGRYDAVLDFAAGGVPPDANTADEISLPAFPVALEKQLGLKLVKQTGTVDVFVIDHIGTLSEN